MKKTLLNQGLSVGLLLVVAAAHAEDYPAANFQPKVLFQDESITATSAASSSSGTASSPCVAQETAPKKEEVAEFDPRYPASNFQPKVLFSEVN